ncbi:low temperature requirement protein A [Plantactinospora soyae]|uniref:Low temperature requirement protein LtrA n=1 Tax=Plantactinospora soyae TaxID=1544732 RepID=A0A927MDV8_9ACTN|nr:low temperature requirement protein A [Plantactinospora soyae]MBE1491306.1 low temperature requirement protein LtrA [Plantactinospora soyae]
MAADNRVGHIGDSTSRGRATYLELFLDLVYVFALTRLSQRLTDDFTVSRRTLFSELGQTLLVLLALWQVWLLTAWVTSRFDPRRIEIQLLVIASMFGALIMAVSLPQAFGERGVIFASTFVAIQIGRPLFLVLLLRGHPRQPASTRILFWSVFSSVGWIAGALNGGAGRGILWTAAVALEFIGAALRWPTPGLGRTDRDEWRIGAPHLAERYQQVLLIALGEAILVSGFVLSAVGFAVERTATFVATFLTTVFFWRVYFYQASHPLASAFDSSRDHLRFSRSSGYTHLVMVCGIVSTAVGYGLLIADPYPSHDLTWISIIFGGPALFLAGRAWCEQEMSAKVASTRWYGILALALLTPVAAFLPLLVAPFLATAVLAGIVVADVLRNPGELAIEPNPPV